ncbi:hypothetical protein ACROYT_G014465 [Oculina patagonica]
MDVEITKVIVQMILNTCMICMDDDFNLPMTRCCDTIVHKKCIRRWKRSRSDSAVGCPFCTRAYKLPNQEHIEADERVMMRLNQICATRHPETEVQERCLACIYFRTGLNAIQKHEFAFILTTYAAFCEDLVNPEKVNRCHGCTIHHSSQREHSCLMMDSEDVWFYYHEEAREQIDLDIMIKTAENVCCTMGFKLGQTWESYLTEFP